MADVLAFGLVVTVVAAAGLLAIASSRLSEIIRVPTPALFLIAAAITSDLVPSLGRLSPEHVQRIVTVALVFVLFDGGALLPIAGDTVLQPGDEVLALVDPASADPAPHFRPPT